MSLESLDLREVESAIEGILFASGEPLPIDRICLALDLDRPTAEQVLQKLGDYYAFERRGIRLVRMEDSYQLCSSPDYADVIRKAFEIRKTAKLSQPALETVLFAFAKAYIIRRNTVKISRVLFLNMPKTSVIKDIKSII